MDVEAELVYADILRTLQSSILNTNTSVSLNNIIIISINITCQRSHVNFSFNVDMRDWYLQWSEIVKV